MPPQKYTACDADRYILGIKCRRGVLEHLRRRNSRRGSREDLAIGGEMEDWKNRGRIRPNKTM
jgi:hypothetical protein